MSITNNVNLYISPFESFCDYYSFYVNQGDFQSRNIQGNLYVVLTKGGTPTTYTLADEIVTIIYEYVNSNGETILTDQYACVKAVSIGNNVITFTIPNDVLITTGSVNAQIKIYADEYTLLNSTEFKFYVSQSLNISVYEDPQKVVIMTIESKGDYYPEIVYEKGNTVTYEGSVYLYIYPTSSFGNVPTNTTYWMKMASSGDAGVRGTVTFSGTAITGTSTTPTAYTTGIASAIVNDRYQYNGLVEENIGNVYRCTTEGNESVALWVYDSNIRGATGDTGDRGTVTFSGTAITGTSTTPTAYTTGIASAIVNDRYRNIDTLSESYQNEYKCTFPGDELSALWAYDGNVKGIDGIGTVSSVNTILPIDGDVTISASDISATAGTLLDETTVQGQLSQADTEIQSKASSTHVHGNISNDGKIGSAQDLPIFTGTDGLIETKTIINARTALGLGDAATKTVGTSEGNLVSLITGGKFPSSVIPAAAITEYKGTVASKSDLTTLSTAEIGDYAIVSGDSTLTNDGTYILNGIYSVLSDWVIISTPNAVSSVNGYTGVVSLTASDVGAATTGQGSLADSALQPEDVIDTLINTSTTAPLSANQGKTLNDSKQPNITASGILKGNGSGAINSATDGTDYLSPSTGLEDIGSSTSIQKGNGAGQLTNASAGIDYLAPVVSPTNGHVLTTNASGVPQDSGYAIGSASGIPTLNSDTKVTASQTNSTINSQAGAYTLVLTDAGKLIKMTSATAVNLTIPLFSSVSFSVGTEIEFVQYGAGIITVVATGGVTLHSANAKVATFTQYACATLKCMAQDEWLLAGYLG